MSILFKVQNRPGRMHMKWISHCWKSLKCTLFSIQLKYCDLQRKTMMLYTVSWKRATPTVLSLMF